MVSYFNTIKLKKSTFTCHSFDLCYSIRKKVEVNMHKLTLVQKAVNLGEYQDMILKGQLPLVVRLTEEEVKSKEFSLTPFSGFYYRTFDSDGFENQFLHEDRLREAIEEKKIFIPEFIDLEDKMKYVDYISNSNSVDFGGSIVFRDKKRVFKGCQARDSIQKINPM